MFRWRRRPINKDVNTRIYADLQVYIYQYMIFIHRAYSVVIDKKDNYGISQIPNISVTTNNRIKSKLLKEKILQQ